MSSFTEGKVYSIRVINQSTQQGNVVLFQKDQGLSSSNMSSIAWLSKPVYPNMQSQFQWETEFSFNLGEGANVPGAIYHPFQVMQGNTTNLNTVKVNYNNDMAVLEGPIPGMQEGNLYIESYPSVALGQYLVGFGMGNQPTFVGQVIPGLMFVYQHPNPKYYITFGYYTQGQILESNIPNAIEICFPEGVTEMTATYNPNGTWTLGHIPN